MERPPKRSERIYATRYPTQLELNELADAEQYEKLEQRLRDRTTENLILDVEARREIRITNVSQVDGMNPYQLSKLASDHMDIRVVLDLASKSVVIAKLTASDDWWKTRLYKDFPECPEISEFPFKNVYFVVRYSLKKLYQHLADTHNAFDYNISENIVITFRHLNSLMFARTCKDAKGLQLGSVRTVHLDDMLAELCKFRTMDRKKLVQSTLTKYRDKIILRSGSEYLYLPEVCLFFLFFSYKNYVKGVTMHVVDNAKMGDLFERGYVLKVNGKPVIGAPICLTCLQPSARYHLEHDESAVFCSEKCV